jgi:hypothetical protein
VYGKDLLLDGIMQVVNGGGEVKENKEDETRYE